MKRNGICDTWTAVTNSKRKLIEISDKKKKKQKKKEISKIT